MENTARTTRHENPFMGTPEFAQAALLAISDSFPNEIVAVVTRQDTPKNRGHAMTPLLSKRQRFPWHPRYPRCESERRSFPRNANAIAPDIIVVAAYGRILPLMY